MKQLNQNKKPSQKQHKQQIPLLLPIIVLTFLVILAGVGLITDMAIRVVAPNAQAYHGNVTMGEADYSRWESDDIPNLAPLQLSAVAEMEKVDIEEITPDVAWHAPTIDVNSATTVAFLSGDVPGEINDATPTLMMSFPTLPPRTPTPTTPAKTAITNPSTTQSASVVPSATSTTVPSQQPTIATATATTTPSAITVAMQPTSTPQPTHVDANTNTPQPTSTPDVANTPTNSSTSTPDVANTPTDSSTSTPNNDNALTNTPTKTNTPDTPTKTNTPTNSPTNSPTNTPTNSPTNSPTNTPLPLTIAFRSTIYRINENAGSASISVQLNRVPGVEVQIDYVSAEGSAKHGNDFQSVRGTLTFAANQQLASFDVPIIYDNETELDETFTLFLSNPVNAQLGTPSKATVTIINVAQNTPIEHDLYVNYVHIANETPMIGLGNTLTYSVTYGTAQQDASGVYLVNNVALPAQTTFHLTSPTWQQTAHTTFITAMDAFNTHTMLQSDPITTFYRYDAGTLARGDSATIAFTGNITATSGTPGVLPLVGTFSSTVTIADNGANGADTYLANNHDTNTIAIVPVMRFQQARYDVAENAGYVMIDVALNAYSADAIRVDCYTVDSSAKASVDYLETQNTLTFAPNSASKRIIVPILDNNIQDGDRFFLVSLRNATNSIIDTSFTLVMITDDEAAVPACHPSYPDFCVPPTPPVLTCASSEIGGKTDFTVLHNGITNPDPHGFDPDGNGIGCEARVAIELVPHHLNVTEQGANARYMVQLSSRPTANVTVQLTNDQQVTVSKTTLTFTPDNWNTPQQVVVSAVDDVITEGEQTGIIAHTVSSGDNRYNTLAVDDVTVTITDNDPAEVIITPTTLTVSEPYGTHMFTVKLASKPQSDVAITLSSSDPTQCDISVAAHTIHLTSNNWQLGMSVTVNAIDDDIHDGDQTCTIVTSNVSSSDPFYNGIAVDDIAVTVTDDDTVGIVVRPTTLTISEPNSQAQFNITLLSQPTADVTINLSSSTPDECIVTTPLSVVLTASNWQSGVPVVVEAVDDVVKDGTQTCTINADNSMSDDADYHDSVVHDVTVTVADDDVPAIRINPTTLLLQEPHGTAPVTFTLTTAPQDDVVVALSASNSQCDVQPATVTLDSANWSHALGGAVVMVRAVDDDIADGTRSCVVLTDAAVSTDADYHAMNPPNISVQVADNDALAVVVSKTNLAVSEAGTTDWYTVYLASQPTGDVMMRITPDAHMTVNGSSIPIILTFTTANWYTPQIVTVAAVDDAIDENPHPSSSIVQTTIGGGYSGVAIPDVVVAITDNDGTINNAPVLTTGMATLPIMQEDTPVSLTINSIVNGAISDVDGASTTSIALVATGNDNPHTQGTWQYHLASGTTWEDVAVAADGSNALLLSSHDMLRFNPTSDYNGVISNSTDPSITFRAWDETSGTAGARLDLSQPITATGGSTPFSSLQDTIIMTITPINDAPSFTPGNDVSVPEGAGSVTVINWATNIMPAPLSATDETTQTLTFIVDVVNISGTLQFQNASSEPAILDTTTGDLTFRAKNNTDGVATIEVTLSDGFDISTTYTRTITVTK